MKLKALLPLVPLSLASALAAGIWTPNQALYLRTNGLNVGGDDFTGSIPSNDLSVIGQGIAAVDAGGVGGVDAQVLEARAGTEEAAAVGNGDVEGGLGAGEEAVLDTECRVNGAENLRVIDASAMPDLVSGNIHAAVLVIAEKVSDHILGNTYLKPVTSA